jgi:hypothetical protein
MKKEKIQLTLNTGVSKEVLLQGTSHPLKVIKYLLFLVSGFRKTSATYIYCMIFYCDSRRKVGKVKICHYCMMQLLRVGLSKILPSHTL